MRRLLICLAMFCCALSLSGQGVVTPLTTLTLQVHWADGAKASGTVTLTGNGITVPVTDNNNGIYTAPVALVGNVAYNVKWQSANDPNAVYLFPFFVPGSISVSALPAEELDLVFWRSTDPGGFRRKSWRLVLQGVDQ
jgi:hypothetical protein